MSGEHDDRDGVEVVVEPVPAEAVPRDRRRNPAIRADVPWPWWEALIVFLLSFVLTMVAVALLAASTPVSLRAAVSIVVSIPASLVVTVGWLAGRYGRGALVVLGPVRPRAKDLLIGAGYGLAAYLLLNLVIVSLLALLASRFGFELPEVQQELQMAIADSPLAPLVIFNAVVLAPVGEELLYRGMLFQALLRRLPAWPAIVVSGVLFGAAHLEWLAVVITGAFGMYLAWLMRRRGSLLVPIAAHGIFNGVSVVLLLIQRA